MYSRALGGREAEGLEEEEVDHVIQKIRPGFLVDGAGVFNRSIYNPKFFCRCSESVSEEAIIKFNNKLIMNKFSSMVRHVARIKNFNKSQRHWKIL